MSAAARLGDNPLLVLGLELGATRMEVERQAQLLLGMLELGFADALTYPSPLGPRPRTADAVRAAAAALRDPVQRLDAEVWFLPALAEVPTAPVEATAPAPVAPTLTMPDALARLGWGPRARAER
jgi:hypothetical protein